MIEVRGLGLTVGEFSLQGIDIYVPQGMYGVLMGKTGSGKTTILESICGLRSYDSGQILLDNLDVTYLKPAQRGIGLVPQDGALFRQMTVREHLEFSLEVRKWSKDQRIDRVAELSSLLGLDDLLERYPFNLSGGERQRVALGRALAFRPKILCLDEPLSALDDDTREDMIELLKHVQKEVGVTALHVTHNRREANELADVRLQLIEDRVIVVESFDKSPKLTVSSGEPADTPPADGAERPNPALNDNYGQAKKVPKYE